MLMQLVGRFTGGNATSAGGTPNLPGMDSGSGTILVGLAGFVLIIFPILKFIVTGIIGLFVYRFADRRFQTGGGKKPAKLVKKLAERFSGKPQDVLESRQLKVTRLTDELSAMRASIAKGESGGAAEKLIREASRRDRTLVAWRGVLGPLELTDEERVAVGKALAEYAKKEMERREEVVDLQSSWLKGALKGVSPLGSFYSRWRLGSEMDKQLSLEAQLFSALREALPEAKFEKLSARLVEAEDLLCVASGSPEASQQTIYVLSFNGDTVASQVAQLQREVSAILALPRAPEEVVIRIGSPGGTVTGYGLAAAQLMRIRDRGIKLTACVDEVAASGGYLMACCADRILCSPFAAIGSIGVISGVPNAADRLEREGVKFIETTAGKWKRTITPFKVPSSEDLAKAQLDLLAVYEQFSSFVKANRPAVDLDVVATGEVWFGQDALNRGLVDELGTSPEYLLSAVTSRGCEVLALNWKEKANESILGALLGESQPALNGAGGYGVGSAANLAGGTAADVLRALEAGLGGSSSVSNWPIGTPEPRFQADSPLLRDAF